MGTGDEFAYWDPATGTNTIVRTYDPTPQLYAKQMAFSPEGTRYILDNDDKLYTIDKYTGNLTFMGIVTGLESGDRGRTGDLAFDPDGRLYVVTYRNLYELDFDTLTTTMLTQVALLIWKMVAWKSIMMAQRTPFARFLLAERTGCSVRPSKALRRALICIC